MSTVLNFHDTSTMAPDHHYSNHHDSSVDDGDFFDEHPVFEAIFCYGWLFFLFYCLLCRNKREPPSTEVGDRIRARAREVQERIEQKKIKEDQSPEERKRVVDENMITKVVLSKDSKGNLSLGSRRKIQDAADDDVEAQQAEGDGKDITHLEADDEEGHTCVICLDCFEPDDLVSWTKHDPTCKHVFHDECIRQWLEERRQDECPNCRCHLVPPMEFPKAKSLDEEIVDTDEDDDEEVAGSEIDSSESSDDQAKDEEHESTLFAMMSGLLSRATVASSSPRRPASAPASGEYNLVSVNSGSFDSQDAPERVQEPEETPQHQQLDSEPPSSSSSDEDSGDEESNQRECLGQSSNTYVASLATMSVSEALRQTEAMEDEESTEVMDGARMELGMQHAVTEIAFSG